MTERDEPLHRYVKQPMLPVLVTVAFSRCLAGVMLPPPHMFEHLDHGAD